MKKVILTLLFATLSLSAIEHKVIFDVRSGSADVIDGQVLGNISLIRAHYAKVGDTLKAVVILSGGTYPFFKRTTADKMLANELAEMASIEVCSMGLAKRKILPSEMLPFVKPAFNRTEALIRYQNAGYAYILVP